MFNLLEENVEFLPIIPMGLNDQLESEIAKIDKEIPLIVVRNTVQFPQVVLPIGVSREKSNLALNESNKTNKLVFVSVQKDGKIEEPTIHDIEPIGTIAKILKVIKLQDNSTTVILQGLVRAKIKKYIQEEPYYKVSHELYKESTDEKVSDMNVLIASIKDISNEIIHLSPNIPQEASVLIKNIEQPSFVINFICNDISESSSEKQKLLEINSMKERGLKLMELLQKEIQFLKLKNKVMNKTKLEIDKQQKEYFLQQQLKSIKEELVGETSDKEVEQLKEKAKNKKFSKEAQELFDKGIERLEKTQQQSPEYGVVLAHLEFMIDLPWQVYSEDNLVLKKIKESLDNDHFGMKKIKERILDYLAVLKLKKDMKSPILCFVGPPGIGKTSLGKSIANAIGRKYVRVSLGGLHDEAEIRGHRKTYIGAMPGRILKSLTKCKTSNPVMVLDEIDKTANDFRGDPSSALLEVLDPEQNHSFYDNYLETEFDLSKVLFIATANSLSSIQPALRDRLEIIDLNGYALEEKIEIAKRHLVPKQLKENGLGNIKVNIHDNALEYVIQNYTRESGVRNLERQISTLARSLARAQAEKKKSSYTVAKKDVEPILGKKKFSNELYSKVDMPGVAVGLAWTSVGGEILFIESALSEGKGELKLTGNLGNIMKESATTALTFLHSNAKKMNIDERLFKEKNIHIHVPEGATPKDGPSAGITMLSSLASVFSDKKIKPYLAMTGEITLRGQVLPVGGIMEKVLAAKRMGLKKIILSKENKPDIDEIESHYLKGLEFIYVDKMSEVLQNALY